MSGSSVLHDDLACRITRRVLRDMRKVYGCGPGVPPDDVAHVLERGWSTKASGKRGLGLGPGGGWRALGLVSLGGGTALSRRRAPSC